MIEGAWVIPIMSPKVALRATRNSTSCNNNAEENEANYLS
jgi:hypothetical protein